MFMFLLLSAVIISVFVGFCNACEKNSNNRRPFADVKNFSFFLKFFTGIMATFFVLSTTYYALIGKMITSVADLVAVVVIFAEMFFMLYLLDKAEKHSARQSVTALSAGWIGFALADIIALGVYVVNNCALY